MLATSIGTEKKNAWISVRSPVGAGHDVADRQLVVAREVELVEVAVDGPAQVVLEVHADLGAEVAAGVVRREAEDAGHEQQDEHRAERRGPRSMMLWSRMRCWMSGSSPISTWATIEQHDRRRRRRPCSGG